MKRSGSRALALGGVAAGAAGLVFAVATALATPTRTNGVAGAQIALVRPLTHSVDVGGTRVVVTERPDGAVCFRAPAAHGCVPSLGAGQIAYATGGDGARSVLVGVAGPAVDAVIAKLTRKGTVWATLRDGVFYAELPPAHRLRAVVKVVGATRTAFRVSG